MSVNNYPLVSVLIIIYNQEKYIEETLNSILVQDYPNVEIIASDDASTDGTAEIINRYAAENSNIKPIISETNGGITNNCNKALPAATGKYIIFIGGDDLMLPGRITTQVGYFQEHPETSVCCTDIKVFYDDKPNKSFIYRNREFYKMMGPAKIIAQGNAPPTSALMFDSEKCKGIIFDPRTPIVSDWLFVVESCLRGKIGYIDAVYTCYRRHSDNSTSGGIEKSYLQDRLIYTDLLICKYPQFKIACKKQRCNIYYLTAKRHFMVSDFKRCRELMVLAWLEWPFRAKIYVFYFATFVGRWVLKAIKKYKGD